MKILRRILLSLFALWLGSGIIYEINPRWFMSDTATEVPENPNEFVGKLAKAFRRADTAAAVIKEAYSLQNLNPNESAALPLNDQFLTSDKDYLSTSMRLDSMRWKAESFHETGQAQGADMHTVYSIANHGLVWVSVSRQQADGHYLYADYAYVNDRPFSAKVYGGMRKGEESLPTGEYHIVWQPDGSVFRESGKGKVGIAEYEFCAACYQTAQSYLAGYADVKESERLVREFQQKSNRIAADRRDNVFYRNLPEIMPDGMRANSLVVGYDMQKRPQKIYLSFDDGRKRHSFEYYLENGKPFLAQSSTVALAADGVTADAQTYRAEQKWYLFDGRVIRKVQGETLPDFPLSRQKMEHDIRRSLDVAAKRGG